MIRRAPTCDGNIEVVDGNTVIYQLNGLGTNLSINIGEPSIERLKVLQREALELALYTFRYLPDVEGVVTLLPPPPPEASATATATPTPAAGAKRGRRHSDCDSDSGHVAQRDLLPARGSEAAAADAAREHAGGAGADGRLTAGLRGAGDRHPDAVQSLHRVGSGPARHPPGPRSPDDTLISACVAIARTSA